MIKKLIKKDRWFFLISLLLLALLIVMLLDRHFFVDFFSLKFTDVNLFGKVYTIDMFNGLIFTLFIISTIAITWYFGGHVAFMIIAIAWNFEIALFITINKRPELCVEFINIPLLLFLYFKESPADRKQRLHNEMIEQKNIELTRLNFSYARFVPTEFLNYLNRDSISDVVLGDASQREMTVMFSDIRSFTRISESMSPRENFDFINSYLGFIGPVIREHNGFIDKYIGDAIMALFPNEKVDAINCAINMRGRLEDFNKFLATKGIKPIETGIGIHSGMLMLGTIGEDMRMDSTVIADAVNLASRLEGLTKIYKAGIIVSESLIDVIKEKQLYTYRFLDKVKVKGKKEAVNIYELLDNSESSKLKIETLPDFNKGMQCYSQHNYNESISFFKLVADKNPADMVSSLYIKRCIKHHAMGTMQKEISNYEI